MRTLLVAALLVSSPLVAADMEQYLLPIEPSVVYCAYHSRYDTRLVVYNDSDQPIQSLCNGSDCRSIAARRGAEISGSRVPVPLPRFLYLSKADASRARMTMMVESMDLSRPEERSFTELPVVPASAFRSGVMQFVGVRVDQGFRQTLRIYGLDPNGGGRIRMRAYDPDTGEALRSEDYYLYAQPAWVLSDDEPMTPSFNMECDLSEYAPLGNRRLVVELESPPDVKYWAFISVTNNATQHFYTVMPQD